jgi:hypothetical protein
MTEVTKEQAQRVAGLMYPELWASSPVDAIVKAIEFIYSAASYQSAELGLDGKPTTALVSNLKDLISRKFLHVNTVASALGLSAYTIRTWLQGKYTPSDANLKKLADFMEQYRSTPQILKPEV